MNFGQMLVLAQVEVDDQAAGAAGAAGFICTMIFYLAIIVIVFASFWKLFEKAGKPGWAGIVPIYNLVVLLEIVGRPIWWIVLFFIPCVSIIVAIVLCVDVAKSYGKDTLFAIGLFLLPIVFYPILAFGSARYVGPAAATPKIGV
jgi:hypothetical protein